MLEQHKGAIALLKAYKELARQTNLQLVTVGDNMLCQEIRKLIRQYKLSNMVHVMAWVHRDLFYALLRDAASLVIPSIWPENLPLVALEALSVSTPVVGSNVGGLPEIVSYVDRQLAFSWELEGDFARAIKYCLCNNGRLRERASRANSMVGKHDVRADLQPIRDELSESRPHNPRAEAQKRTWSDTMPRRKLTVE